MKYKKIKSVFRLAVDDGIGIVKERLRMYTIMKKTLVWVCPGLEVRLSFRKHRGVWPDLEHPATFSEKIQWFKLHVRDPIFTRYADKYAVREYVKEKVGGVYLVSLIGVYHSADEIDFARLPSAFVLKPNHESGEVLICKDKTRFDCKNAKKMMDRWMKENYYYHSAEWHYKNIPPKILCERLLPGDIVDYRFFCFAGQPVLCNITADRGHTARQGYVDADYQVVADRMGRADGAVLNALRPKHWEQMLRMASILSEDFPFVRVDLYEIEGHLYFGELTFTPSNGMDLYLSVEWDKKMGEMYDLSTYNKKYVI